MSAAGMDGVPISAVVKLAKLAYCFEHWDIFDAMVDPIKIFIKVWHASVHFQNKVYISTFLIR